MLVSSYVRKWGNKSGLGKLCSIDTKLETKTSIKCEQCKEDISFACCVYAMLVSGYVRKGGDK